MGLVWSEPRKVKGTKIVINASIPTDKPTKDAIWAVWNMHKENLRNDGFGVGKHPRTGLWQVSYWHTITSNSESEAENGRLIWQHAFDNQYAKWENIVNKIKNSTVASIADASEEIFEDE